jgi:Domain of unknown function (DUF4265)
MASRKTSHSSQGNTEPDAKADQRRLQQEAQDAGMVKIAIADHEGDFETPWATPVGPDRFRLENTPFFSYGLSWHDVVEAKVDRARHPSLPVFTRVIQKSGHRTIRVAGDGVDVPQALVEALVGLGATYEGVNPAFLCFDLAPKVNMQAIIDELEAWAHEPLAWEHADPTWEEIQKE